MSERSNRSAGRRAIAGLAGCAVLLVGCGGEGTGSANRAAPDDNSAISALFASYDVAVGDNPRVIVGLVAADNRLVSFGTAEFTFAYVGNGTQDEAAGRPRRTVPATWIALPGQDVEPPGSAPRVVDPSDGTGVYAARDVHFDRAGFWEVEVSVDVEGQPRTATAAFEVQAEHQVTAPGDRAPATANPLPGTAGVDPRAIDSRAADDGVVPDQALHRISVADALASGRPTMIVVSTPVFCQSRFCGPVTDAVETLANEYTDRINFVHLEVWEDFEGQRLTDAAREWIVPTNGEDGNEPWVFLVGADGVVVARWDNVASESELRSALSSVAG